ncbi:MAG: primosomal protein N' [bacterium]|nr:primosomal protein N' [bacterium]
MEFAEIIFQQKVGSEKNTLTYEIGDLELQIGQLVKVPLRKQCKTGIVWDLHNKKPSFKTSPIKELANDKALLSQGQIKLIKWMADYYFCPIFKILKLFIPKRVFDSKPIRETKYSQAKNCEKIRKSKAKKLSKDQETTLKTIIDSKKETFVIHGITGSGKTEVYYRLAENFIKKGKQVLILVPEISLTPQTIEYFEKALGIRPTVINSKISEGEKYHAWNSIWRGEAKIIIGSRSAIFCPFQKLGLIVIDEEHENSYKQENAPRYSTHKVAEKMQEIYKQSKKSIKIVLGSATPSIETVIKFDKSTIHLKERIGKSVLPEIKIVDLRDEFKKGNYSIFSDDLKKEMIETLGKKEQIILFLNRRGSASSVVCRDCGYSEKCKGCDTTLTYHARTLGIPSLICHHCGEITPPPTLCPICKGVNIRFLGIGTQKIETELAKEFPNARTLRADKDTTSTKHGFEEIYKKFRNNEADILVGTQMIAKGLHLPKVNLVGVILADIGLNIPDFRAAERNFQLMTQVAGRAGRTEKPGKVVIQTYNPNHLSLICTQEHDYEKFLNYERTQRKLIKNPPYSNLSKLLIQEKSLQKCQEMAKKIEDLLWKFAREEKITDEVEINSYPSYLLRLRGNYRYIILIKSTNKQNKTLLEKLPKEYIMNPNLKIDIDPISIT